MGVIDSLAEGLGQILRFFHDAVQPVTGFAAWGWAIVLLTVTVRLVMLPLAVKQINSMRAMQRIQPEVKKVQQKFKTDRSLMKTDPERYRQLRAKQQEELMKLYKEHNVNPAAGCLPLVLQMPIFFALFRLLNNADLMPDMNGAAFYLISGLRDTPGQAGFGGVVLIALMALTTFASQKQMMDSNPTAAQMPQQKVLLYVMPLVLTMLAINLNTGVLLYWVTTNLWTMGQQWFMFRNVRAADGGDTPGAGKPPREQRRR